MTSFDSLGLSARRASYGKFANWLTSAWHKPVRVDDVPTRGANPNLQNSSDGYVLRCQYFSSAG